MSTLLPWKTMRAGGSPSSSSLVRQERSLISSAPVYRGGASVVCALRRRGGLPVSGRLASRVGAVGWTAVLVLASAPCFAGGAVSAPVAASAGGATIASAAASASGTASTDAARAAAARMPALTFANVKVISRSVVTYRCADGQEMGVAYMNTDNQQSFAVLRLGGQHLVLVSTLAASGVRYIGGRYIWWTKGDEGNLYDQQNGENAPAMAADCKALGP